MSDHWAIKPNDGTKFFAIMAWNNLLVPAQQTGGVLPTIFCYECVDARRIEISKHLKTFLYFCHASESWDIHELETGIRIAGGFSIAAAYQNAVEFLKGASENSIFQQMRGMRKAQSHMTIVYSQAMEYLKTGEKDNPHLAKMRRTLENSSEKTVRKILGGS